MSTVSAADAEIISALSSIGVLVPFRSEKFHHCQAMACCSDGFRVHMPQKLIELCRRQHDIPMRPVMFRYEAHGIAMRFGISNPLSPKDYAWLEYLPQFEQAQRVAKGEIQQYNLVHHWPCVAAADLQIDFVESLLIVLMSKVRIKRCGPFRDVSMLLWIDRPNDDHEVFRIKKEPLLRCLQTLPDQTLWQRWLQHEALLALEAPAALQAA
ncbi:MAG: hypothetical protein ACEQSB_01655 [Undibacterium sp.]